MEFDFWHVEVSRFRVRSLRSCEVCENLRDKDGGEDNAKGASRQDFFKHFFDANRRDAKQPCALAFPTNVANPFSRRRFTLLLSFLNAPGSFRARRRRKTPTGIALIPVGITPNTI